MWAWSSGDKELQDSLAAELRGEVFLLGSQWALGIGGAEGLVCRAQVHRSPSHRPREASLSGSCAPS